MRVWLRREEVWYWVVAFVVVAGVPVARAALGVRRGAAAEWLAVGCAAGAALFVFERWVRRQSWRAASPYLVIASALGLLAALVAR